jgi:formylglycine-generating enzyme required for sulfatase activity
MTMRLNIKPCRSVSAPRSATPLTAAPRALLTLLASLVLFGFVLGLPACSDDNGNSDPPDASVPCTTGTDLDGDHFGPGCPMGEDCDDSLAGIWGPCENGCPTGWARVPEGPFVMGCDRATDSLCSLNASPAHTVILTEPYCVQLTEVTVGAYRRCVEAGVCPERPETTEEAGDVCNYTEAPGDWERQPVNCVSISAARTFCQDWVAGDLPTEAQWEKAARGTDERLFPWGNEEPTCARANFDVDGPEEGEDPCTSGCGWGCGRVGWRDKKTWEVGSAPDGDSPYGARDLVGNVSEYVLDCHQSGYESCDATGGCVNPYTPCPPDSIGHLTRGGDAYEPFPRNLTAFYRNIAATPDGSPAQGFRCVRSVFNQ